MAKKKKAASKSAASKIKVVEDSASGGEKLTDEEKVQQKVHGWKASAIRLAAAANPKMEAQELAETLTKKHGEEFSYNMVYQTINKPAKGTKGKPGRKKGSKNKMAGGTIAGGGIVDNGSPMALAAQLIGQTGSMAAAQQALNDVANVAAMLKKSKVPF